MVLLLSLLTTDAQAQDQFSFTVVGDTQTDGNHSSVNWNVLPQLVEDMSSHDPQFGLFVGDLVGGSGSVSGTVAQWADFISATSGFAGDVLPVLGNHDVYGGAGTFDAFAQSFNWLPQNDSPSGEEGVSYYVDNGNTRFIAITSDQESGASYQVSTEGISWLGQVLQESDGFEHVFVMTHHPVSFSAENNHGGTGGDFWQLLTAYGVTGLFSGHWHRYQPSQPGAGGDTWETIIGTGGGYQPFAPIREYQQMWGFLLVEVDGAEAVASFYADADGDGAYDDLMDQYSMASAEPIAKGLVARYRFEEGLVYDSAPEPLGRGIHGSLENGALLVNDSLSGEALVLTGASDYVEAGAIDDYVLSLNGDLTLSLWAKPQSLSGGSWPNNMLTYATNDYYTEDEETNYSYWFSIQGDSSLRSFWEYGNGNNVNVFSSEPAPLSMDTWHHLVITRDATAMTATFYVDGEQLGEPQAFDRLPTGGGRGMLYFGDDTRAYNGASQFDGMLDEVCIFNTALSAEQVAKLALLEDCESVLEEEPLDTGNPDTGEPDPGEPDTDTGETPVGPSDKAGGCGCASDPRSSGWPALLLLGMAPFRRRQSRHISMRMMASPASAALQSRK
jgi:MYXO-CTERM domain-containing protein